MESIYNYVDFLPDLKNSIISCIPTGCYFLSVKFYSLFQDKKNIEFNENYSLNSSKNMIFSSLANIFLSYPLFLKFSDLNSFNFLDIVVGILTVDSIEYFFHFIFHKINFIYQNMHSYHHKPPFIEPRVSFFNNDLEILITSPVILFFLVYLNLSFLEYIFVTSLSYISTVCDHTVTSKNEFHYISSPC